MQSRVPLGPGKFHVVVLVHYRFTNERLSTTIGTIGLPRLAQ